MSSDAPPDAPARPARAASFVERAEAALRGEGDPEIDVVTGRAPAVIAGQGRSLGLALVAAAIVWGAAWFVDRSTGLFSPVALAARSIAWLATFRALVAIGAVLTRALRARTATRWSLVLTPGGLLVRAPDVPDVTIAREDVVAVAEETPDEPWSNVAVVAHPDGGRSFALPPFFDAAPRETVERLMRWRGPFDSTRLASGDLQTAGGANVSTPEILELARRRILTGAVVVHHVAPGWRDAPLAGLAVAAASVDALARASSVVRVQLGGGGLVIVGAAILLPLLLWRMSAKRRSQSTVALVVMRDHLLAIGGREPTRINLDTLTRVWARPTTIWSLSFGALRRSAIDLERGGAETVRVAGLFELGADAAARTIDAFREASRVRRERDSVDPRDASSQRSGPSEDGAGRSAR